MTCPLRSSPATEPSSLLRGSPPLSGALVLSASRLEPLAPFPLPSPARFSRSVPEPGRASRRLHAGCRSDSIRTSPELIPEDGSAPGFDIAQADFDASAAVACARLSRPCLRDHGPDFSATLTTAAIGRSGSRWLGIGDLITEPEGPSFSPIQLRSAVWTGDARDARPIAAEQLAVIGHSARSSDLRDVKDGHANLQYLMKVCNVRTMASGIAAPAGPAARSAG